MMQRKRSMIGRDLATMPRGGQGVHDIGVLEVVEVEGEGVVLVLMREGG